MHMAEGRESQEHFRGLGFRQSMRCRPRFRVCTHRVRARIRCADARGRSIAGACARAFEQNAMKHAARGAAGGSSGITRPPLGCPCLTSGSIDRGAQAAACARTDFFVFLTKLCALQ
jgi:hypothetical protein